jgi:uncharacterized protein DUF4292
MNASSTLAFSVGVALLLSGCPARPCPARRFDDATSALAHYGDMRRPARVLRAEARVDRRDSQGRIRGTVLMFIERPDRVRFDAMTQLVGPAATLTSDGDRFALMDLRENRFFQGPTCPANIERLLGIRFSGEEVTRLLLGETPQIEAERRTISCSDGSYRVTLHAAGGRRQELVLEVRESDLQAAPEDQRMRLRRSEVFGPNGQTEWRVTYDDYRFIENPSDEERPRRGLVMPFTVRFEDPRRGVDTMVRFSDVDLNVEVPSGAFTQQPRPGLRIENVRCN